MSDFECVENKELSERNLINTSQQSLGRLLKISWQILWKCDGKSYCNCDNISGF